MISFQNLGPSIKTSWWDFKGTLNIEYPGHLAGPFVKRIRRDPKIIIFSLLWISWHPPMGEQRLKGKLKHTFDLVDTSQVKQHCS